MGVFGTVAAEAVALIVQRLAEHYVGDKKAIVEPDKLSSLIINHLEQKNAKE